MATAYDDYLAEQAAASIGTYEPSYDTGYSSSYAPSSPHSYDPYYDPGYTYDQQPSYDYGYDYAPAPAPTYDPYYDPGYTYDQQPAYQPAPTYQTAPTPQPYLDPGYTLDQTGYTPPPSTPAQPPPDYVTLPGETQPYNPSTGEYWTPPPPADQTYASATLPSPERNPAMPAPTPAPAPAPFVPQSTDPYQTGDAYSTGAELGGLWAMYRPIERNPTAQLAQTIDQAAAETEQALADREALAAIEQRDPLHYNTALGYGPMTQPPAWWEQPLTAAADFAGTAASAIQQSPPGQAVGDALGTVGDTLYAGFDVLRDNAVRDMSATQQAGIGDMATFVDENTPFLGGIQQAITQTGENLGAAENVGEIISAPVTGAIPVPDDWMQRWQAETGYDIATNPNHWMRMLPTNQLTGVPVIGQLFESPINEAATATPEEQALIISTYENAELAQPGSGPRAVWELYQSDRNWAQRGFADAFSSPYAALPPARAGTAATAGAGRLLQTVDGPVIQRLGRGLEVGSNVAGTALGSAEAASDLGITALGSQIGGRLSRSRLGAPFRLTDAAQAELAADNVIDATTGLRTTVRASDDFAPLPPAPPGQATPPPPYAGTATTVTPPSLPAAPTNGRTPAPPFAGQATRLQTQPAPGSTVPPGTPRGVVPPLRDQPHPETVVHSGPQGPYGTVQLTSDHTGRYWITRTDTGDVVTGPGTADLEAQLPNMDQAVRQGLQTQGATPPEQPFLEQHPIYDAQGNVRSTVTRYPEPTEGIIVPPGTRRTRGAGTPANADYLTRTTTPTGPSTPPPGVGRQTLAQEAADLDRVVRLVEADPNASLDIPERTRTPGAGAPAELITGRPVELPVLRMDTRPITPEDANKPHGLYVSLADSIGEESPHAAPAGSVRSEGIARPQNPLVVGEPTIEHRRFPSGRGLASSGLAALKALTTPDEFDSLLRMRAGELRRDLQALDPANDYSRYYDAYELLEAYAAHLARAEGFDAIIQRSVIDPEMSEAVILDPRVISFQEPPPGTARTPGAGPEANVIDLATRREIGQPAITGGLPPGARTPPPPTDPFANIGFADDFTVPDPTPEDLAGWERAAAINAVPDGIGVRQLGFEQRVLIVPTSDPERVIIQGQVFDQSDPGNPFWRDVGGREVNAADVDAEIEAVMDLDDPAAEAATYGFRPEDIWWDTPPNAPGELAQLPRPGTGPAARTAAETQATLRQTPAVGQGAGDLPDPYVSPATRQAQGASGEITGEATPPDPFVSPATRQAQTAPGAITGAGTPPDPTVSPATRQAQTATEITGGLPPITLRQQGSRRQAVIETPQGDRRPTVPELDRAYQRLREASDIEYTSPELAAWRFAMYGRRTAEGGQYLRKQPAMQPTVRETPAGTFQVVNARTNTPLNPGAHQISTSYRNRGQAEAAVRGLGRKTREQEVAHERFLDLQAERLRQDPIREAYLRDPAVGDPVPEDVVREIKRRANVETVLPPAPDGQAIDVATGQRVTVDPPTTPATRLGVRAPTAGEHVEAGLRQGQSIRDRMARPGPVRQTAGREARDRSVFADPRLQGEIGRRLANEELELLETKMPKTHDADTTVGDVVLRSFDELQEAADLARAGSLTDADQARLDALAAKYHTTPAALAAIDPTTPAGIDALDGIGQATYEGWIRREFQAAGKEMPSVWGQRWTETKDFLRSFLLYNRLRVPAYINTNLLGNAMTSALKPSTWFGPGGIWDVGNINRIRQRIKQSGPGKLNPDDTVYGSISRALGYQPRQTVVGAMRRDQLDKLWGATSDNALKRGASKTLLSEEGYWVAQAVDQNLRDVVATTVAREQLPRMVREVRTLAKETAQRMGVLVSDAQIDAAIDTLADAARRNTRNAGVPVFSQVDLENALKQLTTNAGPSPANWANRIGRDWREATTKLMAEMDQQVDRFAFSFRQTNADSVLSNVLTFHYWASRASKLYVTEALKNPLLLSAYVSATEGLERMAEQGNYPDSVKGFIRVIDSLGGFTGFIEPQFWLPSMLTASEQVYREDGEYGLTKLGEAINWVNSKIGILHPWRIITYYSGMEGGGNLPPDPFYGFRDSLGAVGNLFNQKLGELGWLGFADSGILDAPVQTISNRVAHWFSGLITNELGGRDAGFRQVPLESAEYLRGEYQLRQIVSDIVAEGNPGMEAEDQGKLIEEIMADPSSDLYQEAYGRWVQGDLAKAGARLVLPVQNRIRNANQDARAATIGEGMITDPATGDRRRATDDPRDTILLEAQTEDAFTINEAVRGAGPEDAAYQADLDAFFAAEDDLGHQIDDNYWRIVNADLPNSFKVNGRTYTPEAVAALTESQRYRLADEWLGGISAATGTDARARMETRYDAQNAIVAENPHLAGAVEFRQRAREYPAGVDAFIADTAAINKPYRDYLSTLDEPVGSEEYRDKAIGYYRAAQIVQGQATDIFNPLNSGEGKGRVAGLPEETTLANAWHIRQAEREEEQAAREAEQAEQQAAFEQGSEYIQDARRDLQTTGEVRDWLATNFGQADADAYLARILGNEDAFLSDAAYEAMNDQFEYPWPRQNGGAEEYLVWANQQPAGADVSFDAWRQADRIAYEAEQARLEANPEAAFDPATLVGRSSQPAPVSQQPTTATGAELTQAALTGQDVDGIAPGTPDGGLSPTGLPAGYGGGAMTHAVLGGAPTTTDYGFRAPTTLPFYKYFAGHGGTPTEHTGIDALGTRGQPMYAPQGGTVTCGGTGNGGGSWGTGCAAFFDDHGGAGRIEVMLDDGTSLIFGHAETSSVQPGDRVSPGQVVGTMGTGNGADHVHIERRIWRDDLGTYWLIDPETGL